MGGSSRAWFPARVSKLGFLTDVREGQASNDGDRKWILGIIKGQEDEVNLAVQRKLYRSALYMFATTPGCRDMLEYVLTKNVVSKDLALLIVHEDGIITDTASSGYRKKRNSCLQYLLDYGCDPNSVSDRLQHGYQLNNVSNPCLKNANNIVHPLEGACAARNHEHVRILLQYGSDPDFKHQDNTTLDDRIGDTEVMNIMRAYKSLRDATVLETALKKHWVTSFPFMHRLKSFFTSPAWICK